VIIFKTVVLYLHYKHQGRKRTQNTTKHVYFTSVSYLFIFIIRVNCI